MNAFIQVEARWRNFRNWSAPAWMTSFLDLSRTYCGHCWTMFAKVYHQIFDSSIAEDHQVRHMFMDLLVLADMDGVVDMTLEAIARRTNVPIEQVTRCVGELTKPDPKSRSSEEHGVRLKLIDSHRDWGWQIINYAHYRELRDEESRRAYFRDHKRKQRAQAKSRVQNVQRCPKKSNDVTHAEAEAEAKGEKASPFNFEKASPTARLIVHEDEFKRVLEKIRSLRASYSEHQDMSPRDVARLAKLRDRKLKLMKILGVEE